MKKMIVTGFALALVASTVVPAQQRKSPAQIDKLGQQLTAGIQNLRNQERAAIQSAMRTALADPRVQKDVKAKQAVMDLERAILTSRDRADRELPGEVVGLFKLQASGRSAPPIPGKQGAMNGERKIQETYARETGEADAAISRAKTTSAQMEAFAQAQSEIEAARRRIMQEILKLFTSLLTG